jgi:CHAD domain-containing protein
LHKIGLKFLNPSVHASSLPIKMPMRTAQTTQEENVSYTSAVERETKLMVDEKFSMPHLPGRTLARRVFTSTYYDTPDHCLAHACITLRYRLEGHLVLWQLKLPLNGRRREIELRGEAGEVPLVFSDGLVVHLEGKQLVPVATLRTWRTGVRVQVGGGGEADVVLDSVSVLMGGQIVQRFRELEIEWLRCNDHLGDRLVDTLRKAGARPHDGRPKLFRALSISYGLPAALPEHVSVRECLRQYLSRQVEALKRFDPGTRFGGEPEDLHQMRVATRRMRAVLRSVRGVLDPKWADPLVSGLTWLGQLLGFARDLDVQLEYLRSEASQLGLRDRKPVERFVSYLEGERANAQRTLVGEMKSARYLGFLSKLEQAVHEPTVVESDHRTEDLAARTFGKLSTAMRELPSAPSNADIHRVRIKAKRARYVAELAEPAGGKSATRFIKVAKEFQDLLGTHHDAVLAEQYMRGFVARLPGERAAFVAGLLMARAHQRRDEVLRTFRSAWKRVKKRGKKAWS